MTQWKRLRFAAAGGAIGLALMQEAPARAESQAAPQSLTGAGSGGQPSKVEARPSADNLCRALARAAADNGLPVEFLTRLIWLESRFNPDAVSPKGAQGIAQFMPRTASGRGLTDPFEPLMALREAASYLRELRTTLTCFFSAMGHVKGTPHPRAALLPGCLTSTMLDDAAGRSPGVARAHRHGHWAAAGQAHLRHCLHVQSVQVGLANIASRSGQREWPAANCAPTVAHHPTLRRSLLEC